MTEINRRWTQMDADILLRRRSRRDGKYGELPEVFRTPLARFGFSYLRSSAFICG
jgi:hypothetical protein